jgi:dephospho-CoA kinase
LRSIAITGGVASGKSSVARLFEEMGAYVVSCDSIVHRLLSPQHPIGQQVVQLLGPGVVVGDRFNRAAIADRIFRDPVLRESLEAIIHPAVWQAVQSERLRCPRERLFVVEVPLLFESVGKNEQLKFDAVICVDAPVTDSRRWAQAAGMAPEEFDRREQAQLSREEKARRATYVIANHGDPAALRKAATDLYTHLTQ